MCETVLCLLLYVGEADNYVCEFSLDAFTSINVSISVSPRSLSQIIYTHRQRNAPELGVKGSSRPRVLLYFAEGVCMYMCVLDTLAHVHPHHSSSRQAGTC